MAELDAAYFHLYGLSREDVEYVLSTFQSLQTEPGGIFEDTSSAAQILRYYDEFAAKAKSSR